MCLGYNFAEDKFQDSFTEGMSDKTWVFRITLKEKVNLNFPLNNFITKGIWINLKPSQSKHNKVQ